jgi:hypothetical protein
MLNVCFSELTLLDLQVNSKKCSALRIGKRYRNKCAALHINSHEIPWNVEVKYLGVHIVAGAKFKCYFDPVKVKYYKSANAILAKLGNSNNKPATLKLISTIALPCLTYALEALSLTKTELKSLDSPWMRSFEKLFKTFDKHVIKQCQLYSGYLPLLHLYALRTMSFIDCLKQSENIMLSILCTESLDDEVNRIALLFDYHSNDFNLRYRDIIYSNFHPID